MTQTAEEILAGPDRIYCTPFPHNEFTFPANISPRTCICNQVAGLIQACRKCRTGAKVKAAHPEISVTVTPLNWANPWMINQVISDTSSTPENP